MGKIQTWLNDLSQEVISWRRHFHQFPELSWEENKTAKFISGLLCQWGYKVYDDFQKTAVLAHGKLNPGLKILLRADMDALEIEEQGCLDFKSKYPGVMHACGHDGHIAMLLGVAKLLSEISPELKGSVVFCFQPAEEGGAGGQEVVNSELVKSMGIEEAYALHLYTGAPTGAFICPDKEFLASADEFEFIVHGISTHGAMPHTGIDPIVIGADLVLAVQSVISRNMNPLDQTVMTIGKFSSGQAHNVIPDRAQLLGSFRTFSEPNRNFIKTRLQEIKEGCGLTHRTKIDLNFYASYPPTRNHPEQARDFRKAAQGICDSLIENQLLLVAEDFSFYLNKYPGAMAFLGAGGSNSTQQYPPHHSSNFNFDENALIKGVEIFWNLIQLKLGKS
ncbi:MAG: hypothetical protein APR63_00305 [Desulfuromonas sp. SDB]|nr:MAG: hypothetical protein APR63_00305 [Desulfuromonas sp. SDB]